MPSSLSGRLLAAVSLLLLLFFGITILLLESAFRTSAAEAIRDRLDIQLTMLVAAAEPAPGQVGVLVMGDDLAEPRFGLPASGLYGQVSDTRGRLVWQSASTIGGNRVDPPHLSAGEREFARQVTHAGEAVFVASLGVYWERDDSQRDDFVFTVAEHLAPFLAEVRGFRHALFGWFAVLTILLLSAQALLLRHVLRPLRQVEREIIAIEQGNESRLRDGYPRELQGVTGNLNALLAGERDRLARYRNTLGNLAHSLKTPLAVMRSSLKEGKALDAAVLQEQVEDMQQLVTYQLQRAAAMGATTLGQPPVSVAPLVNRLRASLTKVYADKHLSVTVEIAASTQFIGDEGDLMEVLGNLMDNACKWATSRVVIKVSATPVADRRRPSLRVLVEDDGPGIPAQTATALLERGARADERVDGSGLGLDVVREIVHLYGGELGFDRSSLGGAAVEVVFLAS
jgi:two-component system sensor histidine kinase PhoQ